MQKARHHPDRSPGSDCLRAVWFQVLFHSPPGVLFTFPSRYWFAIGGSVYLALEGGPPRFPQGSSCPVVLGYQLKVRMARRTGLSPPLVRRSRQLPKTHPRIPVVVSSKTDRKTEGVSPLTTSLSSSKETS
jgi:hypothetical protein